MQLTNFTVSSEGYLASQDRYFDLHNCYDFKQMLYNPSQLQVELHWQRNTQCGTLDATAKYLIIQCISINDLEVHPGHPDLPPSEKLTLSDFGFIESKETNLDFCFHDINIAKQYPSDLIFLFQDKSVIRLKAKTVSLLFT